MPTFSAYAQFTKASGSQQVPATGLTVTCTLYIINRATQAVTTATPTPLTVGDGVYGITYSTSVDVTTYDYLPVFATTDGTVQQTKIGALVTLDSVDVREWAGDGAGIAVDANHLPKVDVEDWKGTTAPNLSNSGAGANVVTITVNDGTNPLQSASVTLSINGIPYTVATNSSGIASFSLDNGTYTVAITLSAYSFTPTTLVISGNTSHTYSMTATIITPSAANKTTGYLVCYDKAGATQAGVPVTCTVSSPSSDVTGGVYDPTPRTATSGADGLVQFVGLFKGVTYTISAPSGTPRQHRIPTAAGTTYELPSIIGGVT